FSRDWSSDVCSSDLTGPMTRWVEDLGLLMPILCGPDNRDCAMAPVPLGDPRAVDLSRLRVAYNAATASDEIQATVHRCAGYFAELGCEVVEDMPPKVKELSQARSTFTSAAGSDWMQRLLAKHGTSQASPGLWFGGEGARCS